MKKILIVEDEAHMRKFYTDLLTNDYEIAIANDGHEAFQKATREGADCIITDIKMPDWDGAQEIRNLDVTGLDIKIIVASGFLTDELNTELMGYPAVVACLRKPFSLDELRNALADALGDGQE